MLRIPQTRYAAARGLRVGGNSSISSLRGFGSSSLLREEGFMAGDGVWVKSPRDINQHLDKYIVGQEKAKKTLSVAVFNHYHRIVHSREQAQAARDRESAAVAAAESLAEAEAELESSKKPETVIPTPVKRRKTRDTAAEEQEQRRIESRVVEPDPTKIHEPSTWTGRNFYTARYPPSQSARAHEETESSTLLGRLSGAFTPSFAESLRMPFTRDDASGKHQTMSSYEESQRENKSKEAMEDEDIDLEKSNVLMLGPTGSGKTLLARTLARILDVPFASSDATSFTQAGYVGEDVESAVGRLLKNAEYDVARTEIGIIHIDEVDKLARRGGSGEGASWGGRDVGGEGVQQALLKLLEGTSLTLQAKPAAQVPASQPPVVPSFPSSSSSEGPVGPKGPGVSENWQAKKGIREGLPQHGAGGGSIGAGGSKGETFTVDTTNILFILSGAFVGMEQVIARRTNKGSIGFNAVLAEKSTDDDEVTAEKVDEGDTHKKKDLLSGLTSHDLVEYGFIPEFVGRVPVLAPLHPLSLSDLMRILTEPKNAVIKQQRKLFSRWGCELQFSDNALKAIAKEAVRRGGSARHLKSVISDLLLEANYESPGSSVRYAAVTEAVVLKQVPVLYFSRGQKSLFERALADDTLSQSDPQTVQDTYSGPNESTYYPAHNTPSDEPEPVRAFGQLSKSRMDRKNGVYGQRRLYHASAFRSQQPSQKNKPNRPNPGKPKSNAKSTKRRQAIASQDLRSTRSATRSPVMQCIAYSSAERYDLLAVARELNRQEVPFTLAFEQDRTDQAIVVSGWNFGLGSAMNARSEEAINLAKLAEEAAKQVDVPVTTEPSVYPNGNSITDTAIYDQGRDGEIWIFKSGSFVTWGMSLAEGRTFIREVIRNKKARIEVGAIPHHDIQTEEVDYVTDPSEETRIKGNLILLGRPPALHSFQQSPTYASFLTRYTFSVALARSSALALVEAKLNAHLESVGKVPGLLETTGTQPLKRKEVIRKIGELMVLREAVNFRGGGLEDTPEIYWSEPQLESYFDAVSTEFEMEDRIETINQKIDYASEVQSTLRALLTEGSAHRMEVIIIALIAVEVVLALIREGPELMHSIVNLLTGMDVVSKQFAIPTAIAALSPFSSKSTWAPASSENPLPIAYHVLSKPLPYQVGLDLQNSIIQARLQARRENPRSDLALQDVILLLEHTPTYTTGRRDVQFGEADSHPEQRKIMQSGAQFYYTKRGGQVTYHGPGQLVGYPLIDLQRSDITTRCYVSYLQDILASYAREDQNLSVLAPHPDDHVGVFANASEKLASIGIHMRHRISSHGFAINVTEEPLSWFNLVTACGLNDVRATSIQKMLSSSASATQPTVRTVAEDLMPYFSKKFGRDVVPLSTLSQSNAGAEIISRLIGQAEKQAESVTSQSREVLARTHISQPS